MDKLTSDYIKWLGRKAEEYAFSYEQWYVSEKLGFGTGPKPEWKNHESGEQQEGYDILSVDENGREKFIECKAVHGREGQFRVSGSQVRFLSDAGSQSRFYLVIYNIENIGDHRYVVFDGISVTSDPFINVSADTVEADDFSVEPMEFRGRANVDTISAQVALRNRIEVPEIFNDLAKDVDATGEHIGMDKDSKGLPWSEFPSPSAVIESLVDLLRKYPSGLTPRECRDKLAVQFELTDRHINEPYRPRSATGTMWAKRVESSKESAKRNGLLDDRNDHERGKVWFASHFLR